MKTGSIKSVVFTPPAIAVRETRQADLANAKMETDPQEAVLLYGHMLTDVDILAAELRGLLFAGAEYRSRLRVVRSASRRLSETRGAPTGGWRMKVPQILRCLIGRHRIVILKSPTRGIVLCDCCLWQRPMTPAEFEDLSQHIWSGRRFNLRA